MSSIPKNKDELVQAIQEAFDKLLIEYTDIPEEYSRVIGFEGNIKNTEISIAIRLPI